MAASPETIIRSVFSVARDGDRNGRAESSALSTLAQATPMLPSLRKLFSRPAKGTPEPSPLSVRFDDWGVYTAKHRKDQAKMEWKEIKLIAICIEDSLLPLPYWYFGNKESLLRIPNNVLGAEELFFEGFAEKIPGYKCDTTFRTIIEASAAMEGTFILWRSADAEE